MKPLNPFKRVFDQFQRVAITGAPSCGKTTLAKMVTDRPVFYSDDFKHLPWSEASAEVANVVNNHSGACVVEGVAVARALRKGMKVDAVIYMKRPKIEQKPGQIAMGKGIRTVFDEWRATHPDVPVFAEPVEQYSPFEETPEGDAT